MSELNPRSTLESNSDKYRAGGGKTEKPNEPIDNRKHLESVVKGKENKVKRAGTRLRDAFIVKDIKSTLCDFGKEVIVPGIKMTFLGGVARAIGIDERIISGGLKRIGGKDGYGTSYTAYHKYADRDNRGSNAPGDNADFDYRYITFDSRGEAELVLDTLRELIEEYGKASVADYLDLTGFSSKIRFTDKKYGWVKGDLDEARARQIYNGYELLLPKERPLDS